MRSESCHDQTLQPLPRRSSLLTEEPDEWRLYTVTLFFSNHKPQCPLAPLSSSYCDQRPGLPFCTCQGVLAWLIRVVMLKCHSKLCNHLYCYIFICMPVEGCRDEVLGACTQIRLFTATITWRFSFSKADGMFLCGVKG